jgi:hypothetical protein
VVLGGRKVSVERPRGRTTEGTEVELDTWAVFSSEDLLTQLVCERMLAGVATRRHADVGEPMGAEVEAKATATGRSSVSRRWRRATEAAMAELMARDLNELDIAVVMIDGVEIAGQCCVVAMVICTDGTKVPVGLWLGDTENKTVVTNLLADLQARGLSAEGGLRAACWWSSTVPRPWPPGCARCSATRPWSSVALCTREETSRTICPTSWAEASTGDWLGPSRSPIRPRARRFWAAGRRAQG